MRISDWSSDVCSSDLMPVVADARSTCLQMIAYTGGTWALTLLFAPVAGRGAIYVVAALATGAMFTFQTVRLLFEPTPARARRVFGRSITYVGLLFGAMALDQLVRTGL